jgi:hypothetical protein
MGMAHAGDVGLNEHSATARPDFLASEIISLVRTIGMTVKQAEAILAAAGENHADSFLASQEQGSGLIEASLLAEEDGDGIVEVITVDEQGTIVAQGDDG